MKICVNHVNLYYEVKGRGNPLIMVHGNGEDHTIFNEAVNVLQEYFTVYLPDSRCHGKSQHTSELHYQDMADDMVAFMEKKDLRDVIFYGFSDGGIIGLLAAMKTDRIRRLIISGANIHPKGVKTGVYLTMKLISKFIPDPKLKLMLNEPQITETDLAKIRIPVLVLAGSKDMIREEHTRKIARALPKAYLRILKGETHGSYIVGSMKIANYILKFAGIKKRTIIPFVPREKESRE